MQHRNLSILAKKEMYADFIYAQLYMECGYPTVNINLCKINYICAILVLLTYNCINMMFA